MKHVAFENINVPVESEIFYNANVLSVAAGTTGPCGGDSGHGGRTYFAIGDEGSTDISVRIDGETFYPETIEIMLGGDAEMETFVQALEFALTTFKKQLNGGQPMSGKERRQQIFREYLNELLWLYTSTGSLSGMSQLQKKHGITPVTQAQFFEFGLHNAAKDGVCCLDAEFCNSVYEYILDRTKAIPAPHYM